MAAVPEPSQVHRDCPPLASHVRADLHAVYTISPKKKDKVAQSDYDERDPHECLLSIIVQVRQSSSPIIRERTLSFEDPKRLDGTQCPGLHKAHKSRK
jgi:hypothetical protein